MNILNNKKYNDLKNKIQSLKFLILPFIILNIIYFLALIPIIRANFNYLDDLGRVAFGTRGFGSAYSRYISDFLSIFLHTGKYLTDISPLPQLIATFLLSLSSIILIYVFSNKKKVTIFNILAVIPLGLCPYFLECLSYKYDAPYMAISILASIVPILFINKKRIVYLLVTFLSCLIMCMTYQASSGIFPMLIIIYLLYIYHSDKSVKPKKIFSDLFFSVLGYGLGLLFFKAFFVKVIVGRVSTTTVPLLNLLPTFLNHLFKYYQYIRLDFNKYWLILMILITLSFFILSVWHSKRRKSLAFIWTLLGLLILLMLPFGIYPALAIPLYDPRAMYGIGVLLSLMALIISNIDRVYVFRLIVIAFSWFCFVFAFTYGNALAEQKRYADFRIQLVINDLNSLDINHDDIINIQLEGEIDISPIVANMTYYDPVLDRLVPNLFGDKIYWDLAYFYTFFDLPKTIRVNNLDKNDYPIIKETMYHTIYGEGQNIIIALKNI